MWRKWVAFLEQSVALGPSNIRMGGHVFKLLHPQIHSLRFKNPHFHYLSICFLCSPNSTITMTDKVSKPNISIPSGTKEKRAYKDVKQNSEEWKSDVGSHAFCSLASWTFSFSLMNASSPIYSAVQVRKLIAILDAFLLLELPDLFLCI
jgi:hypothetical protein